MKVKNWNKNQNYFTMTPIEKMDLLRKWILLAGDNLEISISEKDLQQIYDENISNIENIFYGDITEIVEKYFYS